MENNIKIPEHVKIELQKSVEIQLLGLDKKKIKSICWTYTCSFDVFFKKSSQRSACQPGLQS